jgi:hypothetical protein
MQNMENIKTTKLTIELKFFQKTCFSSILSKNLVSCQNDHLNKVLWSIQIQMMMKTM